jgi:hypothetical protein
MIVLGWLSPVLALSKEERLILWVSVLLGVLVLGGMIIARIDRWRQRQMEDMDDTPEHVGSFREMYERGELTKEQYDRVLRRMAERAGGKPKPVSATARAEPESPANQEPPQTPPA